MMSSSRVLLVTVWLAVAAAVGSADELSAREQLNTVCEWVVYRGDAVHKSPRHVSRNINTEKPGAEMFEEAGDLCREEARFIRNQARRYRSPTIKRVIERFAVRWDEFAKDCAKSAAALRKSPKAEVSLSDKLIFALDLLGVEVEDADERRAVAAIGERLVARVKSGATDHGIQMPGELVRVCEWVAFEHALLSRVDARANELVDWWDPFWGRFDQPTAEFYAELRVAFAEIAADVTKLLQVLDEISKGHTGPEVKSAAGAYRAVLQKALRSANSGRELIASKSGNPARMKPHTMELIGFFARVEFVFDIDEQRTQARALASRVLLANQRK